MRDRLAQNRRDSVPERKNGKSELELELIAANEKMQDIINAIPGGVAIYRVSDIFETVYFSDGVPELSGYTIEEYQELVKRDAVELTYPEDTAMVVGALRKAIKDHTVADLEFRKKHRSGQIVWVHVQAKQIGEDDGYPLVQCVFHNISALKEAQLELDHLVNSIPGGIATYRVEGERFHPTYFTDGVAALSGYTRKEFEGIVQKDALGIVYEQDHVRVLGAIRAALLSGEVLDVSYRVRHKDGSLIWVHLNGRRTGPLSPVMGFYAVFTGMSAETRIFQSIANETADGIYIIDQNSYELLYLNESKSLLSKGEYCVGRKCYAALHGKDKPCEFCTLRSHLPDGEEHEFYVDETGRFYTARFRETDWNGIPAYIQFIRDVTDEVRTRKEKERLEMYFQTIVKNLPGGIAVVRYRKGGGMTAEYLSDGFSAMTGMTKEEAWALYREDAAAGIHPEDLKRTMDRLTVYIENGEGQCEMTYRLRKGTDGYVWVQTTFSVIQSEGGESWIYAVYHDMSKEFEEQEQMRRQYNELLLQHYRAPGSNALIVGHCNITQNKILEIEDYTDSGLMETFGSVREEFFMGLSTLLVEEEERQAFRDMYLNAPALAAFERKETEKILNCFVKLPKETKGRYVQFKVNLVVAPGTGDVTGILTVSDTTEKTISDQILHQLSVTSYDYVVDLDLTDDSFAVLSCNKSASCAPPSHGCHSKRVAEMIQGNIVPRDREQYARELAVNEMERRLKQEGAYTFSYSLTDESGSVRTKNMTVSAVDLRLGRVCLVCSDITDSVREQQSLLNMIAYTFELASFIEVSSKRMTTFTRETVLENRPPEIMEDCELAAENMTELYGTEEDQEEIRDQLRLKTMLQRLAEKPGGYDFVLPFHAESGLQYKQINVLWGDINHQTVCMVRADVTDMLTAEREAKSSLKKALSSAEKANRAKSDFLSAMSHDIRTPMNAIMGMTSLAESHIEDRARVEDCLRKISISSKHLLSLVNDVLDMSKLDGSKIILNRMGIFLPELVEELAAIMGPPAKTAGVSFNVRTGTVRHPYFFGDTLRLNQILINLLSNAVKFTPEGGTVNFLTEEIAPVWGDGSARYRFTVSDTGIGMSQDFLDHAFEAFARSESSAHIEGTGLGLSITKGLVERMEGEISVESRLKEGSTFRVELEFEKASPDQVKKPGAPQAADTKDKMLDGRYFLIAEDNALNAEILSELLEMRGARSVVKSDGLQTVKAFQEAGPGLYDAILMDVQMPEMNGYEATHAIRALDRPDAKTIPIIAMTANAFAEDIRRSLEEGMNAHVAKPIDFNVLKMTLERVLPEKK